ncbi:hypothetical protein MMC14_006398 [Varicellaria rhodocarpa]|nr:hypothetical protein [Varicellaria rhodocarpa]
MAGPGWIAVDIAGPGSDTITEINLIPDQVRSTAGLVLEECVGSSPSFGGFATRNLTPLMNYIRSPLTNLIGDWPSPRILPLTFFTVTIQYGGDVSIKSPGDYDEQVPKVAATLLGDRQKDVKGTLLESHYRDGVRQYLGYTIKARTSGYTNKWWSPSQTSTAADNMAYECDSDLGTPNATDCNQIEDSQLGAASDTITVGPGTPKVLSSSYCNVAVTSTMLIILTWAQVKASLDELIDLCGSNPTGGSVGGKAYYGTMVTPSLGIVGRQVTGMFFGESILA